MLLVTDPRAGSEHPWVLLGVPSNPGKLQVGLVPTYGKTWKKNGLVEGGKCHKKLKSGGLWIWGLTWDGHPKNLEK